MKPRKKISGAARALHLLRLEHRRRGVISRHRFMMRMLLACLIWLGITLVGLSIGMAGYSYFGEMGVADAYINAAMILSGMGPVEPALKSTAAKVFAGSYAIFSGLLIVIATGFVLAPVFHRVLHKFHVETKGDQ